MSFNSENSISDVELHAYVDEQLEPKRRKEVEAWLARHPEQAKMVGAYRQQNQEMHALFDPILSETLPEALEPQRAYSSVPYWRYAAVASMMFFSGFLGWSLHSSMHTTEPFPIMVSLPQQAALAHVVYTPEVLHPVEVSVKQEKHLTNWLSKRLGHNLKIPNLSALQFELVGGRLLPGEDGPAAQFMYENSHGKRLTLYIRIIKNKVEETAFRYKQQNGISVFYWIDGSLGYALSGEVSRSDLLEAANKAYQTLSL